MKFAQLLSPIQESTFFTDHWGKAPLVIQHRPANYYDDLLTADNIDQVLTTNWLRAPALRLVRQGRELSVENYTRDLNWGGKTFTRVIDVSQVLAAYQQGVTIIIEALHRYWKPLALFCENLTKEIGLRFQANVYVSPANGQGLSTHYDTHDVMILQVYGSKLWNLFEPTIDAPNKRFSFDRKTSTVGSLISEVTLKRGDLLYIPRGFAHQALTTDDGSIHITLGIEFYEWLEVFRRAVEELEAEPEFRKMLPPYFLTRTAFLGPEREHLEHLLSKFIQFVLSNRPLESIQDKFLTAQSPTYSGYFSTILALDEMNAHTIIHVRDNVLHKLKDESDKIVLMFADKKISFPAHVKDALKAICARTSLSVSEIPHLDEGGKLVLAKILAREGFVFVSKSEDCYSGCGD